MMTPEDKARKALQNLWMSPAEKWTQITIMAILALFAVFSALKACE